MKTLILTGLESKPIYDVDSIPLGPWCLSKEEMNSEQWGNHYFEPTFSDAEEVKAKADYILDYCLRVIKILSGEMNRIHGRNYSVKYWHTILMPWLCTVAQVVFERYTLIQKVQDKKYHVELVETDRKLTFSGLREVIRFFRTKEGNHFIYSLILQKLQPDGWKLETGKVDIDLEKTVSANPYGNLRGKLKRNIKRKITQYIARLIAKIGGVYIEGIDGVGIMDAFVININARGKIKNTDLKQVSIDKKIADNSNNHLQLSSPSLMQNQYEEIMSEILPRLLPDAYLEAYQKNERVAESFVKKFNKRVSMMLLGPLLGGFDPMKFIVGLYREHGGVLYQSQHGSNYGTALSFPYMASFEYYNSDCFITWGWDSHSTYRINSLPLPSPLLSKLHVNCNTGSDDVIFVGTLISIFADRMASNPQPQQCFEYRKSKVEFIKNLNVNVYQNLCYRPYYSELGGLPERSYITAHFSDINMLEGNMDSKLKNAKCVVLDHPGTTLYITMAMNKPVILFWNDEHWAMCEQAKPAFKILKDAGILHSNAVSAANFINDIWENFNDWWHSDVVQEARRVFTKRYAQANSDWRNIWINQIQNKDLRAA